MVFKVKNPAYALISRNCHTSREKNSVPLCETERLILCLFNPKPLINFLQDQGTMTPKADCVTVTTQVCCNMISELSSYPKFQAKYVI